MSLDVSLGGARIGGLVVIESWDMVRVVEDWSLCRSRSRAERRRRQGHRQNVRVKVSPRQDVILFGDKLICHPDVAARFRENMRTIGEEMRRDAERKMVDAAWRL